MRIISAPGETVKKNPYLLSADEEKEVAKKKADLQHGLTVPRRYVVLTFYQLSLCDRRG
jgi:large subunit GTPase 1